MLKNYGQFGPPPQWEKGFDIIKYIHKGSCCSVIEKKTLVFKENTEFHFLVEFRIEQNYFFKIIERLL